MKTMKLNIAGMTCSHCARRVEKALASVPGVKSASVKLGEGATVEHDDVPVDALKKAVASAGEYQAEAAA